jgi:hypothetical protein
MLHSSSMQSFLLLLPTKKLNLNSRTVRHAQYLWIVLQWQKNCKVTSKKLHCICYLCYLCLVT